MDLPAGLVTPCLVVDIARLDANVAAMAALARGRGLDLRPHAKTHKCLEIAAQQMAAGACGLTVATVAEAEVFAAGGCTDLFIAYPVWADAARGARLRALTERAALRVGVDSADAAAALGRAVPGLEVLVEVDSGHHRTGVAPMDVAAVATAAERAGLRVLGVFTFPGHAYAPDAPGSAAADEAAALAVAAAALAAAGIDPVVRSGGSTPSAAHTGAGLTELRPGVYVFGDAQQLELGTIGADAIALVAAGTVVSRAQGRGERRIVLDVGSKVLGADRPAWATGFGRVPGGPAARVTALSEHHATVTWPEGPPPELGATVALVPNHVCAAVNLADELVVIRSGAVVDTWRVAARGANT
ncbi:MAG TPA: alanine racemase [Sporichthya sp.]|nr:alanine racemase [Sporichthya sp.]